MYVSPTSDADLLATTEQTKMTATLEDLGTPGRGDCWMTFRHGKNPITGEEVILGSLSRGGFVVIDPRKQTSLQVRNDTPFGCAWAIAQSPKTGDIYHADYGTPIFKLCVWDWKSALSKTVATPKLKSCFTIYVAPDGRVYIPDYSLNSMHRYDPATGTSESLGDFNDVCKYVRNVVCARDGMVYLTAHTYVDGVGVDVKLLAIDPTTNKRHVVEAPTGSNLKWHWGSVVKDATGSVFISAQRFGRTTWFELVGGSPRVTPQENIRLCEMGALAFSDGSYVKAFANEDSMMTFVDAEGSESRFQIKYEDSPTRIFSIEVGGGKVWGGTFIPLTLFSYDIATKEVVSYGNPQGYDEKTAGGGEIYSSVFLNGKLYTAAYINSILTRLDPSRPIRKGPTPSANPAYLGRIKESAPLLQRPYGKAVDKRGMIFFSAHGGYGCVDSGIARIDPATEDPTRWLYSNSNFGPMTYVKSTDELLVSERKLGSDDLMATFISPLDGSVIRSELLMKDGGDVHSWLDSGGDLIYGMYGYRATIFAYSLSQRRIVNQVPELRFGTHCYQSLVWGPDGRIWGLTNESVFAATPDLKSVEKVLDYPDHAGTNAYRFGLGFGPDGCLYFPNGTHLMRVRL